MGPAQALQIKSLIEAHWDTKSIEPKMLLKAQKFLESFEGPRFEYKYQLSFSFTG